MGKERYNARKKSLVALHVHNPTHEAYGTHSSMTDTCTLVGVCMAITYRETEEGHTEKPAITVLTIHTLMLTFYGNTNP